MKLYTTIEQLRARADYYQNKADAATGDEAARHQSAADKFNRRADQAAANQKESTTT